METLTRVWLLLGFGSNFESLEHEVNDVKNDSYHNQEQEQEQEVIWVSLNSSFQLAGSSFTVPVESLSYSNTNILFYSFDDISGVPISMTIDLHFWNSDVWNQIQCMILKQWSVSVLCRTSRVVPMPLLFVVYRAFLMVLLGSGHHLPASTWVTTESRLSVNFLFLPGLSFLFYFL